MNRLPGPIADSLLGKLADLSVHLTVCAPRKTKLGDWRFKNGSHYITINNDLCPEQFFMTLVHEIAHATTWNKYRNTVKPHGVEWKQEFRSHMLPLLVGHFPPEVEEALRAHMQNPSACSGRSAQVTRAMNPEVTMVDDVPMGITFKVKNGLLLEKVHKRRTRWVCKEPLTGKTWLVPGTLHAF